MYYICILYIIYMNIYKNTYIYKYIHIYIYIHDVYVCIYKYFNFYKSLTDKIKIINNINNISIISITFHEMIFPFPLLQCLFYAAIVLLRYFTLHLDKKFLDYLELQVQLMSLKRPLKLCLTELRTTVEVVWF